MIGTWVSGRIDAALGETGVQDDESGLDSDELAQVTVGICESEDHAGWTCRMLLISVVEPSTITEACRRVSFRTLEFLDGCSERGCNHCLAPGTEYVQAPIVIFAEFKHLSLRGVIFRALKSPFHYHYGRGLVNDSESRASRTRCQIRGINGRICLLDP